MSRESINLSEVDSIQIIYRFGGILVPETNQIYYDTMLHFLAAIQKQNFVVSKSSIESDSNLNY